MRSFPALDFNSPGSEVSLGLPRHVTDTTPTEAALPEFCVERLAGHGEEMHVPDCNHVFDDILQRSTKNGHEKSLRVTTTEAVTSVVGTSPKWVLPQCTFQLITSGNSSVKLAGR